MKNINKALSIALSVLLLLSVTSVAVNAAEYTGKCGDSVFWKLDTETGLLTIFGDGDMYNYGGTNTTNPSPFSKYYQSFIKTICIEEGITSVGKNALYDLDQLTSVTIKNNSVVICQYAFTYCDKLTSVTIGCDTQGPGGVEIGDSAFAGCDALSFVTLYDGLKTIGTRAFNECVNLKSLTIPKSIEEIGYMFAPYSTTINYRGESTEWLDFSEINGGALRYYIVNCSDKTIYPSGSCGENIIWEINPTDNCLTFSGFGKMTDYGEWDNYFGDCGPLNYYWSQRVNKIMINEGIETVGNYVFDQYRNLSNVLIPDSVTSIGEGAFRGCSNLKEVLIPDSVTSIGGGAFQGCSNLIEVLIPNSITEVAAGAFSSCKSLSSVIFGDSLKTIGKSAFSNCEGLTSVIIPDSVETIGSRAFSECENLTRVTIGDGVKTIGDYAFYRCTNLSKISVGESVEIIGYLTFRECSPNATIYVHNNITDDISIAVDVKYPITIYYSGTEEEFDNHFGAVSFNINPSLKVYYNAHIHKWENIITPPTCVDRGYVKQTCKICGDIEEYYSGEATGVQHNYHTNIISPTCTKHGITEYTCDSCGTYEWEYSANPTGHSLNDEGVCETCGEKEVSASHINTQMLSVESVLAMVMSLLAKLFGVFTVA